MTEESPTTVGPLTAGTAEWTSSFNFSLNPAR